jgi:glutathione reductase (NADPH)
MEDGESYEWDLVCIGAGSGGVRASRLAAGTYGKKVRAARARARRCLPLSHARPPPRRAPPPAAAHPPPARRPPQVAIVELPFGLVSSAAVGGAGGTCVIRGCVPKKLLVYASEFAEAYADGAGFGWGAPGAPRARPPHDMRSLLARKAAEIERLNGVYMKILQSAGVEYVEGRGVLLDAHTVEARRADGTVKRLRAKHVLIATGSHAVRPDIPGAELGGTSDEALVLEEVGGAPIAIVGGGFIGVEFAGIFAGLGAEVRGAVALARLFRIEL